MNQETLEEVALKLYQYQSENPPYTIITPKAKVEGFIEGARWQAERMYSGEDIIDLIQFLSMNEDFNGYSSVSKDTAKRFFKQFKNKK
jgi:hypothetical protein